jgi:hypothetical protein
LFIADGAQKGLAFGNVFFTFNALGGFDKMGVA